MNEPNRNGWTPLMHAALECRAGIVKLLLESAADAGLRANSGTTSFADHGQSALTIAAGCFIARRRAELAPSRGMPESYVQSECSAPEKMARDLMAHGADVNRADADGRTPLMMTVMQDWAGVVTELLAKNAAVNARDSAGRLAIDYAAPGDREILRLLRTAGSLAPTGNSGRTVCDAQRSLNRRGYDTPIFDCIAGPQFRTVLTKFQTDNRLPATGELDAATRKALGLP